MTDAGTAADFTRRLGDLRTAEERVPMGRILRAGQDVHRPRSSVGGRSGYLSDKPRDPLYVFARSADRWERRTAIVAAYFFIRQRDLADTFAVGDLLAHDPEDLVQKAVGGWVREAGKRDPHG